MSINVPTDRKIASGEGVDRELASLRALAWLDRNSFECVSGRVPLESLKEQSGLALALPDAGFKVALVAMRRMARTGRADERKELLDLFFVSSNAIFADEGKRFHIKRNEMERLAANANQISEHALSHGVREEPPEFTAVRGHLGYLQVKLALLAAPSPGVMHYRHRVQGGHHPA